jgi:beta-phosphoglucomutase-like phosphatase (HAD superfamily)
LLPFFQGVTGGDQVARGKPAPDIYLAALASLRGVAGEAVSPHKCLVFEDSSPGILAAAAAALPVVAVPDLTQPTAKARQQAYAIMPNLLVAAKGFTT